MPLTLCAPRSSVHPARLCHSAAVSVPVALFGFQAAFGYWPDFKDAEDMKKLGAEAFAFVNVARFAVPLRIGLALGTTPWVDENLVQPFLGDGDDDSSGDGGGEPSTAEDEAPPTPTAETA